MPLRPSMRCYRRPSPPRWTIGLLVGLLGLAEPAHADDPEIAGRLELVPIVGWILFDSATALESTAFWGGELTHHFRVDHPTVGIAMFAGVQGGLTAIVNSSKNIDVVFGSAGTVFSYRGLGRLLPSVRAGAGFILIDGAKSALPTRGRVALDAGLALRYFSSEWLVLRAETRAIVYDNVQLGAGSGAIENAVHWVTSVGVGVVL